MTEIGPIDIKLTASGITDVLSAFKNVEDRVIAMERKLTAFGQQQAKIRAKTSKDEAAEKGKSAKQEQTDVEKAEKAKTDAAAKWAKQRESIIRNSALMAGRLAKQQADQEIREAERSTQARIAFSQKLAGRIVNDFRSTLGHATRIFGMLTALGGGFSVQQSMSSYLKTTKSAMALEIASDVPGHPEQRVSATEATARARQMAIEYGSSTEDVLEAQHAIVAKTGRGKQAQELMGSVMKIATAEGTDPKELAGAIASAIAMNPKLTNEEATNLMKAMVDQGKVGAIEIKDLAKIIPILTKTAVLYTGKQSDNQARLVTMAQHAITTTGGPEQAAVAVSRFGDWMSSKKGAKALGGRGFNVFDQSGQLKPIDELMAGVLTHGGNTAQGLGQMGMEGKAKSLVEAFTAVYNASIKEGKTKEQAAQDALKTYHEELMMRISDAKLDSDLKKVQSTDAFKVSQNMEKLSQAIGIQLAPVLVKLIGQIADHADEIGMVMKKIGEFISWASEHPWQAIAIAGAAAFAKAVLVEVAASGLRSILAKGIGGGLPGGGGAGGLGPVATGVIGGLAVGGIIYNAGVKTDTGQEDARNLKARVEAWVKDPKNPAAISPQEAQKKIDAAKARLDKTNAFEQAGNLAWSPFADWASRDYGQFKADQGLTGIGLWNGEDKDAKKLQDAIDEANKKKIDADKINSDSQKQAAGDMLVAAQTMKEAADKISSKPGPFGGSGVPGGGGGGSWTPGPLGAGGAGLTK